MNNWKLKVLKVPLTKTNTNFKALTMYVQDLYAKTKTKTNMNTDKSKTYICGAI